MAAEVIDKRAQKIDVYMPPDKMGRRVASPPTPRARIPKNLSAFPHSYRENLIATLSPHLLPPGPSAIHRLLRHTPITFAYQLSVPRAYIEADRNVREFAPSCENGDPS